MLQPEYSRAADAALNRIEHDPSRKKLWNAICDAIDLVCDRPDSAEARKEAMHLHGRSLTVWKVPVSTPWEDRDWVLLWFPSGEEAVILYVGEESFQTE